MHTGRQEGYGRGRQDGYDERAAFEAEARRLQGLPRFVRPMHPYAGVRVPQREVVRPPARLPWRPAGSGADFSRPPTEAAARVAAASPAGTERRPPRDAYSGHQLLRREGPKGGAYDILRKTADELASLRL